MKFPALWMVFDVESVGLHGEGFAVGWIVMDGSREVESYCCHCDPAMAEGDEKGREWVAENIPPLGGCSVVVPIHVRELFWNSWMRWKAKGAALAADCAWPVETRFLAACVDDDSSRTWQGPYPLHDLASLMLAARMDPLGTNDRLPSELPAHDPLADARQSARLLLKAIELLGGG